MTIHEHFFGSKLQVLYLVILNKIVSLEYFEGSYPLNFRIRFQAPLPLHASNNKATRSIVHT